MRGARNLTYRYRYINPTPVVFTGETVNGRTWQPELGEEADFDHPIDHAFLQLVVPVEMTIEPPATEAVADEPEPAATGDDDMEGQ